MEAVMTDKNESRDDGRNGGPGGGGDHEPDTVTIVINGRPKTVSKNAT
jgi:hypothetical protein